MTSRPRPAFPTSSASTASRRPGTGAMALDELLKGATGATPPGADVEPSWDACPPTEAEAIDPAGESSEWDEATDVVTTLPSHED